MVFRAENEVTRRRGERWISNQRKRTEEEGEQCDLHDDIEEGLVTVVAAIVIQGSRCLYYSEADRESSADARRKESEEAGVNIRRWSKQHRAESVTVGPIRLQRRMKL